MIICVSGNSGVGKDTIISLLVQNGLKKYPSTTTRPRRISEVEGVDYHFIPKAHFTWLLARGWFLDHTVISGHHYGLPINGLMNEQDIVVNLTTNSGLILKELIPKAVLVFLRVPTKEELVSRLRNRGMTDEQIWVRLRDDPNEERAAFSFYDFVLFNNTNEQIQTTQHIIQFLKEVRSGAINTEYGVAQTQRIA